MIFRMGFKYLKFSFLAKCCVHFNVLFKTAFRALRRNYSCAKTAEKSLPQIAYAISPKAGWKTGSRGRSPSSVDESLNIGWVAGRPL